MRRKKGGGEKKVKVRGGRVQILKFGDLDFLQL